jgi:hypothetical protein
MTDHEMSNRGLDYESNVSALRDNPPIQNAKMAQFLEADNLSLRSSEDSILEPIYSQLEQDAHPNLARQESKKTYIDFVHGDPANPLNFSPWRKWFITVLAVMMTILVAISAGAYACAIPDLETEFGVSREVATSGISLYPFGCVFPLVVVWTCGIDRSRNWSARSGPAE